MDWDRLQKQNKLGRSGNRAKGDPRRFIIVGVDISEDDLLAKFAEDDERSRDIITYGARDEARLRTPIPQWFIAQMEHSQPPPIEFYQLIDADGKSWPVITDGRSRCLTLRHWVEVGLAEKPPRPIREIEAVPGIHLKQKGAGLWALRRKTMLNFHIPDSLEVKAERAADFKALGVKDEDIANEIGVEADQVKPMLKWAELFPSLCDEARKMANVGKMRLGGAIRLVNKCPTKAEQKEYLAGARRPKQDTPARPLSARVVSIFAEQASTDKKVPAESIALMRLYGGDESAVDDLSPATRAAWVRAKEQASKRARKAAE